MCTENKGDAGCLSAAWYTGVAWSAHALGADGIQSKELFVRVAKKLAVWCFPYCLWDLTVYSMTVIKRFMGWILTRKVH